MERINYKELLNHRVISKWYRDISILISLCYVSFQGEFEKTKIVIVLIALSRIPYGFIERNRIKKTVSLYNDYIKKMEFSLVEGEMYNQYCSRSENVILCKYKALWEPKFIYENETKVYKCDDSDVYSVNGYFEDIRRYKERKVKYNIVFKGDIHYMSNIDNTVLIDKIKKRPPFYTRESLTDSPGFLKFWAMIFGIIGVAYVLGII